MRAASYQSSSYRARASLGSRLTSLALSLLLIAGILLTLLWLGAGIRRDPKGGSALATFDVAGPPKAKTSAQRRAEAPRAPTPQRSRAVTPPPRTPPPPDLPFTLPGVIVLTRDQYAASDIGRLPRGAARAGPQVADAGGGETTAGEPGAAPGGETLYPAEWYREPTDAETGPFMPRNVRQGWGMIVCRTAPRYRVEDCRVLADTPGSGIANGLRRAAWQFLVRPPMNNGKPMIGAWVRIRFDIVPRAAP